MNTRIIAALLFLCSFSACGGKESVPNTDIDVARAFIKDILDNKFEDAEKFILKESTNEEYFDLFRKTYETKSAEELEKYRSSDIIINEISPVNDTVSIVNFSNSYRKDKSNKVKMVRQNGQWYVDLKYTFSGNM